MGGTGGRGFLLGLMDGWSQLPGRAQSVESLSGVSELSCLWLLPKIQASACEGEYMQD